MPKYESRKVGNTYQDYYMGQVPCYCTGGKVTDICGKCGGGGSLLRFHVIEGKYSDKESVCFHPKKILPENKLKKAKTNIFQHDTVELTHAELPKDVCVKLLVKVNRYIGFIPISRIIYQLNEQEDVIWLFGTDRKMYPSVKFHFIDWRKVIGILLLFAFLFLISMIFVVRFTQSRKQPQYAEPKVSEAKNQPKVVPKVISPQKQNQKPIISDEKKVVIENETQAKLALEQKIISLKHEKIEIENKIKHEDYSQSKPLVEQLKQKQEEIDRITAEYKDKYGESDTTAVNANVTENKKPVKDEKDEFDKKLDNSDDWLLHLMQEKGGSKK